jgi:hypothetical protein
MIGEILMNINIFRKLYQQCPKYFLFSFYSNVKIFLVVTIKIAYNT